MYFGVSQASRPKRAERSLILKILLYLCLHPLSRTTKFGMVTLMGRGVFLDGQSRHCICTMRRTVCQRQLSFLY